MNSKIKLFSAAILASGIMLSTPISAKNNKVVKQIPITADFVEGSLEWLNRPKPGIIFQWKSTIIDGQIAICGAATYPDIQLRAESRAVLGRSYIILNDKKIIRNLRFFSTVKRAKDFETSTANCALTGVKPPKGRYSVYLGWDRGSAKG